MKATPGMTVRPLQSADVHVGEDGWLFLTGGLNAPGQMYRRTLAHAWIVRRWAWLVAARARRCRRSGMRYLHLIVPEKLSVYTDRAPALGIDPELGFARQLCRIVGDPAVCLDARPALIAGRELAETFFRTDSHWTTEGTRIGHDLICATVGAKLRWRLEDRLEVVVPGFVGDLGNKLEPQPSETMIRRVASQDSLRIGANVLVARFETTEKVLQIHRGTNVVFRNEAADADPRRLVLFGDSYSHFSTHGLTAMLAETFREVHFVWSAAIDWGYVERVRPDILVTQIAERFMLQVPRDRGYDNDALAMSRLRELGEPVPA